MSHSRSTTHAWAFVFLSLIITLGTSTAAAQEEEAPVKPDTVAMSMQLDAMVPMMSKMMAAMMTAQAEVLSRPETAEKLAVFNRNYYEALIKTGFTNDEAFRIVTSVGIPSMPGQK